MPKSKIAQKVMLGVLVGIAGILALTILIFAVQRVRYKSKVNAEIALLAAEGGSLNQASLAPKPLPPGAANSADLIEKAYASYHRATYDSSEYRDYDLVSADGTELRDSEENTPRKIDFKDAAAPDEAKIAMACGEFSRWQGWRLFGAVKEKHQPYDKRPPTWNEAWLPYLDMYLAKNGQALSLIKQAASGGHGVFATDWSADELYLPQLGKISRAARLLTDEAVVKAASGDVQSAMEDIRLTLRLRRLIDDDPSVLAKISAMAADRLGFQALNGILTLASPDRAQIEALVGDLDGREQANRMTHAMLGDTAEMIRGMNAAVDKAAPLRLGRLSWQCLAYEYYFLKAARIARAQSRLPFPDALKGPFSAEKIPKLQGEPAWEFYFAQWPQHAIVSEAEADARVAMARTVMALYLYKCDNGAYPQTLGALVPRYISKVQIDPFDGKPLRYKPAAEGFMVYSIGEDRKDDGGVSPGDMVWEREK